MYQISRAGFVQPCAMRVGQCSCLVYCVLITQTYYVFRDKMPSSREWLIQSAVVASRDQFLDLVQDVDRT